MTSKYMQSHENTISSGMSEKGHFGTSHFVLHGEGVLFQRLANEHLNREGRGCLHAVKPLIKDNPKEDKPPNKGQAESTPVHTLYKITSERGQLTFVERLTSLQRTKRLVPKVSL